MERNTAESNLVLGRRLRVGLSDEDWNTIEELAEGRAESYKRSDADCMDGDHSIEETHQIGVAGELAVARAYSLELDTEVYQYGDGGWDLQNASGERIDVKTRTTSNARLVVKENTLDDGNANVYQMVYLDEFFADLIGWASPNDLRRGRLDKRDGERYRSLPQRRLRDLPDL